MLISTGRSFDHGKKALKVKIWFGESNHPFWAMKGRNTSLFQENNQKLRELVRLVGWPSIAIIFSPCKWCLTPPPAEKRHSTQTLRLRSISQMDMQLKNRPIYDKTLHE